tara:strand:- start:46 stop:579 length:534 start_codon:yes stop_codon:yes gene_type:complete
MGTNRKIRTQPNITRRVTATIVDYGIYMSFWMFYVYQIGTPNDEGGYSVNGWPAFILFLSWFIYFPIIESINGRTIGHMITQLRVISFNGRSISFGQALKRRIADSFEIFGSFGLVAFFTVKNSERHQRVGDIWANTLVVGGEEVNCQYCNEKLTLTAEDTISGTFECPECGKKNEN